MGTVRVLQPEPGHKRNTLQAATEIVRAQQQHLVDLLDQVRGEHRYHLQRLRDVERHLVETTERFERASATLAGSPTSSHTLEVSALRERRQLLRQQQTWLAERLIELASSARKLQAVIRQTQLSGEYLLDDSTADIHGHGGNGDSGAAIGQLHALEVQEEERQRLAREIHDGPAQILANAIFELEYCQRLLEKDPKRLESELIRLKDDLREGLAEVRYFIFDLRPGPLTELGLIATLRRYAESYQSHFGITAELDLDNDLQRLPATKEMAIFRIIQEALQNSRKHSGATKVGISVRRQGDSLVVSVEDNGQGFQVETVPTGTARHFGLQSMCERAQLIHADLQIESQPGEGTKVTLRVPIEQNPEL